jgi:hypothetical protein
MSGSLSGAVEGAFSGAIGGAMGGLAGAGNPFGNIDNLKSTVATFASYADPAVGNVVNYLFYGITPGSLKQSAIDLGYSATNFYVSQALGKFANEKGYSLSVLNLALTVNSFIGNQIAGTRYRKDDSFMGGFTTRKFGLLGVIWDVNDTLLGYQGLLDASAYEYANSSRAGSAIKGCHSLGTLTCNNLVARGIAPSARLNSLPFGNVAVSAIQSEANLGTWDLVNGGFLGRVFNPAANSTSCNFGGFGGAFCHSFEKNYKSN